MYREVYKQNNVQGDRCHLNVKRYRQWIQAFHFAAETDESHSA